MLTTTESRHLETREIRLANLLALSSGFKRASQFCERVAMNPTYYSQLKTGRKAIGDDLARRLEQLLNLPRGFMDLPQDPSLLPDVGKGVPGAAEAAAASAAGLTNSLPGAEFHAPNVNKYAPGVQHLRPVASPPAPATKQPIPQLPHDLLGVAFAIDSLAPSVKEAIIRLVYSLAAQASDLRAASAEKSVPAFNVTIGGNASEPSHPTEGRSFG